MKALSFNPASPWQQQFSFKDVKCLIVCRGPIRLEVMQVLEELGARYGILLSEKDSITYPQTLAPELRFLANRHEQVHHIPDYVGSSREERQQCIDKILRLCKQHNYTHLFAGYGFMAEDGDFVKQVETPLESCQRKHCGRRDYRCTQTCMVCGGTDGSGRRYQDLLSALRSTLISLDSEI